SRSQSRCNGFGGEIPADLIYISDDGNSPAHYGTACTRNKGSTWNNHLVARTDAQRVQRQLKCNRPVSKGYRVFRAYVGCVLAFEMPAFVSRPVIDLAGRENSTG